MAYFPGAYKKVFVASDGYNTSLPMEEMSDGMIGFFDAKTWQPIDVADATMAAHPQVVLVQANPYHTPGADKQGPYGGYTESVKSQVIDPRYIERVWKVNFRSGRPQRVFLGWNEEDYSLIPEFTCGKTYHLRLDLKGTTQLRFVGHNLYRLFTVSTGCCTNAADPERVDPVTVLLDFAQQIMADPIISPFLDAKVITEDMDGNPVTVDPATYVPATTLADIVNVVAGLQLWVNFRTDTFFLDCSMEWNDYIETEQSIITSAQLVNDEGKACGDFKPLAFTEKEAPLAPEGTPALILRDLLQFMAYRQEFYPQNRRMRLVKDLKRIAERIGATLVYTSYYILHQVPRHSNPTGVHDGDQYLIQVVFPGNDPGCAFLENWLQSYLSSAGNSMAMEDFSGQPD